MQPGLILRPAVADDAAAIANILGEEVRLGVAHFGLQEPTAATIRRDLELSGPHPFLVAVDDGAVIGFAKSSPWKSRGAYAWAAELGVYLVPSHIRRGVGRRLVLALIEALQSAGFRTLIAGIALPNPGSVGLFEALGFRPIGVFERNGFKHGDWRDVGYWGLHLGDGAPGPAPSAPSRHLPYVQIDAFAERPFEGNPAAVMLLPHWLPDATLAAIAREHNLSETAFVVDEPQGLHLRWFTPTVEVDLCGHATLAAGAHLLDERGGESVAFHTRSGVLTVHREGTAFAMDLPAHPVGRPGLPIAICEALGREADEGYAIKALHHADYWLALFPSADAVAALRPDFGALRALRANVICTARGAGELDFVSRFFAPGSGVDEDPVTGSAHATLTPFWVDRLGKNPLRARQISHRGGSVGCELRGDRVILRAGCVETLRGTLRLASPESPARSRST